MEVRQSNNQLIKYLRHPLFHNYHHHFKDIHIEPIDIQFDGLARTQCLDVFHSQ